MIPLSERQERAAATAVTILAVAVMLGAVAGLAWLAAAFLRTFSAVLLPLAVAGLAALVFQPYFEWLCRRLRLPPPLALVALCLSILLPLAAFSWFFGSLIVEQISDLLSRAPAAFERTWVWIQERWPAVLSFLEEHPVGQRLQEVAEGQQAALVDGVQAFAAKAFSAGAGALRLAGALLSWAVAPVYFAIFLLAGRRWQPESQQVLPFLKPQTREDVFFLAREFVAILVAFFRGQFVIAFLQGVLFAVGFSIVGLSYGFVLGLILGLMNVIPYLGNIVGLAVALPLAFFEPEGGFGRVLAVLVVFTLVQMIEAYILTPRIQGKRTGLHPMVVIVAIFFWGTALGGIMGMVLAIPLTAFLVVFWRLARDRYVQELL